MKKENIVKKLNKDRRELQKQLKKDSEEEKVTQENIDLCPNCNIAYCQGRYTTGQCE